MTHRATAQAHPNIAFIKYWGNRDHVLRLPSNPSLSMNLDGLHAETTVTWTDGEAADRFILNGREAAGESYLRVVRHLDVMRARLAVDMRAVVESHNNFPTGAGIASSAAAFAALTVAAAAAAGVALSERELTTLARQGSGSAARSVPTGFVEWHTGETDAESFAESIAAPDHWDLTDVIAVVSAEHKPVGSTKGHGSADTSDLQAARVAGAAGRLAVCRDAVFARDFAAFAEVVERDSDTMHAVMMTSRPPLFYWLPGSLHIMARVRALRAEGVRVCYTLDAGPNVHCLCLSEDAARVADALRSEAVVESVLTATAGGGARVIGA
jgi:diphosphomevalonate decarboxylase